MALWVMPFLLRVVRKLAALLEGRMTSGSLLHQDALVAVQS